MIYVYYIHHEVPTNLQKYIVGCLIYKNLHTKQHMSIGEILIRQSCIGDAAL